MGVVNKVEIKKVGMRMLLDVVFNKSILNLHFT